MEKEMSKGWKTAVGLSAFAGAFLLLCIGVAAFSGKITVTKKQ